jgi:hypothetical protein
LPKAQLKFASTIKLFYFETSFTFHIPQLNEPLYSLRRHSQLPECGYFSRYSTGPHLLFPSFVLEIDTSPTTLSAINLSVPRPPLTSITPSLVRTHNQKPIQLPSFLQTMIILTISTYPFAYQLPNQAPILLLYLLRHHLNQHHLHLRNLRLLLILQVPRQ